MFLAGMLIACARKDTTPAERLLATYSTVAHRPVQLRLTGFPHRPWRDAEPDIALQAASLELIQSSAQPKMRSAALTFLGRHHDAITTLENAIRANPRDSSLWNDLAVLEFECFRHGDEPRALGEALAAADRAIALNPLAPEPHFNRAAILQELHLRNLATSAWRAVAAREAGSLWAAEATTHTRSSGHSKREAWTEGRLALERAALANDDKRVDAFISQFAQEARTTAEGPLLASWAEFHLSGNADEALKQLTIAREIGNSLIRINREPLLHDAVLAIDHADAKLRTTLANAHSLYKQARLLIHQRLPGRADEIMAEAERQFHAGASPMEFVARAYRVGIAFDRNQIDTAAAMLDTLEQQLPQQFIALRAQVEWDRARIASRRGDVYAVRRHAEIAANLYEQLHEYEFAIRMRSFIASANTALGRADDAWAVRLQTFSDANTSGNPDLIEHVLHAAAKEEIMEKRYDVAASLFGLMLNGPSRSPVRRFEAQLWKAFVTTRLDRTNRNELSKVATAVAAIKDDELRATAEADRWFAEALVVGDTRPDKALALLTQTIKARETRGLTEALPEVYLARGRLQRLRGAEGEAEHDLGMALSAYEQRREQVDSLSLRDSFFAAADSACSELMELYAQRRDFPSTFLTAERCRSRAILDVAASARPITRTLGVDEVRDRLPAGVTLLHYVALREMLLITAISKSAITTRTVAVSRDQLEHKALALTSAMEKRDDASIDRLTRVLHEFLIEPVSETFPAQRLVICADDLFTSVPFAALQNASGEYLVEETSITIAASASSYVSGGVPSNRVSRALLVGDPAFDAGIHQLPRLPAAEREARELSGVYPKGIVLTRQSATAERFLREIGSSDVVHVASHAIVSPRDAALSTLVFAPSAGDNGLIYQSTISEMRLKSGPLVVLAGCHTASASGGRGSIRSLALAFIVAGSRGVIGSLWDVEDEGTRAFSNFFHRRLATAGAADALADAQREMLRSRHSHLGSPAVWAAFQFIGHDARRGP